MTSANYMEFLLFHCANCKQPLPPNGKSISKIKQKSKSIKNSNHSEEQNEISMIEAISYIFGASKNCLDKKLKSIFIKQNNYDIEDCTFPELSDLKSTLSFCENCGPIFSELYEVAKMLRSVSDKKALLWEVLLERYQFEDLLDIPMKKEVNYLSEYDSSYVESLPLPHVQEEELEDSSFVNEIASVKIETGSYKNNHKSKRVKKSTADVNEQDSGFRKGRSLRLSISGTPRTEAETSQINEFETKELSVFIQRLPDEIVRTYSENIDDQNELEGAFDNELDPLYISGHSESDSSKLNDEEFFTKTKTKRGRRQKRCPTGFEAYYTAVVSSDESSGKAKCKFKCNKCDMTFGNQGNVVCHYVHQHFEGSLVHTEEIKGPPFQCPKCDYKFQAKRSLTFHAASVHDLKIAAAYKRRQDSKVLKCDECDVNFTTYNGFSAHQFIKHNRKCYSCTTCGEAFQLRSERAAHRKALKHFRYQRKEIPKQEEIEVAEQFSDDDIFFCRDCNYKFSSRYALNIHLFKSHDGRQKYDCKSCDESFITLISFLKHSTEVHREFPKPENYKYQFTCKELDCGLTFYEAGYFKKHLKNTTHTIFEVICAFCEESFTDMQSMEIHKRTVHSNKRLGRRNPVSKKISSEKLYKCNSCEVIITDNTEMTAHKLIHPDVEMTYKCLLCQNLFSTQNKLTHHRLLNHSTACKDFQCEKCGKKFNGKRQYRLHCRYHSEKTEGIRPVCDLCGKNFSTRRMLTKHKAIIHFGKEEKVCNLCGHVSKTLWNLKLHMKVHEKDGIFRKRKHF